MAQPLMEAIEFLRGSGQGQNALQKAIMNRLMQLQQGGTAGAGRAGQLQQFEGFRGADPKTFGALPGSQLDPAVLGVQGQGLLQGAIQTQAPQALRDRLIEMLGLKGQPARALTGPATDRELQEEAVGIRRGIR